MVEKRISAKELKTRREVYKKGTPVILEKMDDPYVDMPKGLKGIVTHVDDMGTIFVMWENGSGLGVVYDEDQCRIDKGEDK